jgi:hypothetical protein
VNFTLPLGAYSTSKRTTFLSEGVKLCGIICAICAAPLAFVHAWIAIWLLGVLTIVALGTFGVWAVNAIKNKSAFDTEEHTEHMAAIAVMGQNREGKPPLLQAVDQALLTANPEANSDDQEKDRG